MEKYEDIRQTSEAAYRFLQEFDPEKYADGRYDLEDGVYVNISTYTTKYRKESLYEAHKRYTDIQLMIRGSEIIGVEPADVMHACPCVTPYDEEKDLELYANNLDGVDHVIRDGEYVILPPEAAHMPGVCDGGPATVRKMVIKVPV
ncbi:MAG: YhcH/YjgK/YiaL family protein [Eubacteriales bacterium]|nr:YhcH/YjgK/YiaL family protein [Eubacteriales bacterium]